MIEGNAASQPKMEVESSLHLLLVSLPLDSLSHRLYYIRELRKTFKIAGFNIIRKRTSYSLELPKMGGQIMHME